MAERFRIGPGEYHIGRGDQVISTILGSCVATCLFDPTTQLAGMNHFLLPEQGSSLLSRANLWGIHAMEVLINGLLQAGARRSALRAKAFGGANLLALDHYDVGTQNIAFAKDFLERERIPLVAAEFGGDRGREIRLFCQDFVVGVRSLRPSRQLREQDNSYWRRLQAHSPQPINNIELWLDDASAAARSLRSESAHSARSTLRESSLPKGA